MGKKGKTSSLSIHKTGCMVELMSMWQLKDSLRKAIPDQGL